MFNHTNSMKSVALIIYLTILALPICACAGQRPQSLSDLPGKAYSYGTENFKPIASIYTVQSTGEHVLALAYAYQSLVPEDYSSDLGTALSSSATLVDVDGTQYTPIHIYALPCFPDQSKPLFEQFTGSGGTIPCDEDTDLKTVMIVYGTDSVPTTKLTLSLGDGSTKIDIASPVSDDPIADLK
jgi:hypothetical protein